MSKKVVAKAQERKERNKRKFANQLQDKAYRRKVTSERIKHVEKPPRGLRRMWKKILGSF